jgi:hypothetical protein
MHHQHIADTAGELEDKQEGCVEQGAALQAAEEISVQFP